MRFFSPVILEALILACALSLDAFIASFAYGSKKIKIPFKSILVIGFVCSGVTGFALLAGTVLKQYIPNSLSVAISVVILLLLGIAKLMDSITKAIIRKHNNLNKEIKFSLFNFKFILNLYANPEDADVDGSKTLSAAEAASLAAALSLDGITVGLGAAIGNVNGFAVFVGSLVTNLIAVLLGSMAGDKLARKTPFDFSWLSGIILIILALLKL